MSDREPDGDAREPDRDRDPSPRRRLEARRRGDVPRGADLNAALGVGGAVAALGFWGGELFDGLVRVARDCWSLDPTRGIDPASLRDAIAPVIGPASAIVAFPALLMIFGHQARLGGLFLPHLAAPNPSRLWRGAAPVADLGPRAWFRVGWGLAKIVVLFAALAGAARARFEDLATLAVIPWAEWPARVGDLAWTLAAWLAAAGLAIGALDFLFEWRRREDRLRQTPREQRDEQHAGEGDPSMRARRREFARARSASRAMEAVRDASLIVIGKEGLAVALSGGPPPAPVRARRAARGPEGFRLRHAASLARVPIVDHPPLAERLALARAATDDGPGPRLSPAEIRELGPEWPGRAPFDGRPPGSRPSGGSRDRDQDQAGFG